MMDIPASPGAPCGREEAEGERAQGQEGRGWEEKSRREGLAGGEGGACQGGVPAGGGGQKGQRTHRKREVSGEEVQDEGSIQESLGRAVGRQEG